MTSTYPAALLGIDHERGYLKENYLADITVLDKNYNVTMVIQEGHIYNFADL